MKLKKEVNLEDLVKFGFSKVIPDKDLPTYKFDFKNWNSELEPNKYNELLKEEEELLKHKVVLDEICDDADCYFNLYDYIYDLGHSRRGQHYYIIVNESRNFNIIATEPDGSGGVCELGNILIELLENNLIESN